MSGFYIGVDGKARKVKGGYIGIDGKARKIKKGYIGDENGVARLCWSLFEGDPVFANNTWENIALACKTGSVPETWLIGDQKTMEINGVEYVVDIIGKNHDDYADGSGKAPLTFQLNPYATRYKMNSTSVNSTGWESSLMRTTHIAAFLALMPLEVQTAIKAVNKATSIGNTQNTITITADKLFLLSEIEVTNTTTYSYEGEGRQYEYYNGRSKIKKLNGSSIHWWLRSPYRSNQLSFCVINTSGSIDRQDGISTVPSIAPAFCF